MPPSTRRYHYNVATNRLLAHVQKGWEDGLYISAVACCNNLWAVVLDAGTEFTQQIYKVRGQAPGQGSSGPREAIAIEHGSSWARGRPGTAGPRRWRAERVADLVLPCTAPYLRCTTTRSCPRTGSWTSKGWARLGRRGWALGCRCPARAARWHAGVCGRDLSAPLRLARRRWGEGYYITAVAGSELNSCLVVMSKGTRYTQQSYKVGRSRQGGAWGLFKRAASCSSSAR